MKTAHSAISFFIAGLSPTCMFACAWENTLFKVFVGSNDQQWHQPMTFHMCVFYTTDTWLDISFVSITSNFTPKRSRKRSTQHNVINRRTRLHSLDEMDSRVLYLFLLTPYRSSSRVFVTNNTPSGAKKHRESTKPESRQMANMFFSLLLLLLLQTG